MKLLDTSAVIDIDRGESRDQLRTDVGVVLSYAEPRRQRVCKPH